MLRAGLTRSLCYRYIQRKLLHSTRQMLDLAPCCSQAIWLVYQVCNETVYVYLGPGAYQVGTDIVNTMNFTSGAPAEKGTYLINDNGHLNQRTQPYISIAKLTTKNTQSPVRSPKISATPIPPGPGSYETNVTAFIHDGRKISGPIICAPQNVQSSRERAAMFNPSLSKMTVPSIPSRFLTPVIDGQQT